MQFHEWLFLEKIGGYRMFIYEFIVECKENALQSGDIVNFERMSQLLDSLTIEQAVQEIKGIK